MRGRALPIEIDFGASLVAVTFSADGEYLLGGGYGGVRVWRVGDNEQVATMAAPYVRCLAVSGESKWIAAGTEEGFVFVWDAETHNQVFLHWEGSSNEEPESLLHAVTGIDFSPDSTRFVYASENGITSIRDISAALQRVLTLRHKSPVFAAKYSPGGDRIATATGYSVQVYDSHDGSLLKDIKLEIVPASLLWSNNRLLGLSGKEIKEFQATTGSAISGWPIPDTDDFSCIGLSQHGGFIACSTERAVSHWDMSTHMELGLIQHHEHICSIAISPDCRLLAIAGDSGKIAIQSLSPITNSIPLPRLYSTFRGPDIQLDDSPLALWRQGRLKDAEALLANFQHPTHHVFASRALVRARLQKWDAALADANKAISLRPSIIGYIAKSMAHVGKGEKQAGYRACDIAFERFHSSHMTFLLLAKAILVFVAGEHLDAISRVDNLIDLVPFNSICYVVQAYMYLLLGNLRMDCRNYKGAIESFEHAQAQMRHHTSQPLSVLSLIFGWHFDHLAITIRQRLCEALHAVGNVMDAIKSLLTMVDAFDEIIYTSETLVDWVSDFSCQCLSAAKSDGGMALIADVATPILTATFDSPISTLVSRVWAKATLTSNGWKNALVAAAGFTLPKAVVYRVLCEHLEVMDRIADAVDCFHEMTGKLVTEKSIHGEHSDWALNFRQRSLEKLEYLGDAAANAQRHEEAISYYTAALSLNPPSPQGIFTKRSKIFLAAGSWRQALEDANKVTILDPLSPWGYEVKHAALHVAGKYEDAIEAFEMMLAKMAQSPDPDVQRHGDRYTSPSSTRDTIRRIVQRIVRHLPRVLIDTATGRLHKEAERAAAFESRPIFKELVSSMTMRIDYVRIKREVRQYFRYVVLSHRWEENEPLFQHVIHTTVYELDNSPTHDKLQTFCKIVLGSGFYWAWSDTCCIDKSDHIVLQEALVAMFKWYQNSALMIVFLRGVRSSSQLGTLMRSMWNTRAWTLQEYVAAKVIHFYTEDWTLYLDLKLPNHKESPEIVSEMEQATGISTVQLMGLRPGLTSIREKLRLASTRQTTLVEDAAYSLLGVFSVTGLPAIYGEGEASLGRLLAHVLTGSGDVSILAWTGESGNYNSCLPARITVFDRPATSHLPPAISSLGVGNTITMPNSSFDLRVAMQLYGRLNELPPPWFAASRMKLPCIAFHLPPLSRSGRVYRTDTPAFGMVEITTRHDLSWCRSLYLIHPWLDSLLEQEPTNNLAFAGDDIAPPSLDTDEESDNDFLSIHGSEPPPRPALVVRSVPIDNATRARQFVTRLRQPFGALLVTPVATGRRAMMDYKRVAADSLITVQFQDDVSLVEILDNIRTLDIL